METAWKPQVLNRGYGRIQYIFGDFTAGFAHVVLDDGTLLHLIGDIGARELLESFGSTRGAVGRKIRYEADALGIAQELHAV